MSAGEAADGYVQTAWRPTERQGEMERGGGGGACGVALCLQGHTELHNIRGGGGGRITYISLFMWGKSEGLQLNVKMHFN